MAGKNFIDALGRPTFDSGFIPCSDWTGRRLSTGVAKNVDGNVAHRLNASFSDMHVRVFISVTGTNSGVEENYDISDDGGGAVTYGLTWAEGSPNEFTIQTGTNGVLRLTGSGAGQAIDTEDWWYRIVCVKER